MNDSVFPHVIDREPPVLTLRMSKGQKDPRKIFADNPAQPIDKSRF